MRGVSWKNKSSDRRKGAYVMDGTSGRNTKKQICIGLLAHVDAGKTTLSEALLYVGGMIRKLGRVDKKDAYLDTDALERERGITIFSKQAMLRLPDATIVLMDTPGHVDFSAEMERALRVLDYAVLVIGGTGGVQGHTRTLWRLLSEYQIPTFLFVNKMDQPGASQAHLLGELKRKLSDRCVSFEDVKGQAFLEEAAMGDEQALERYLEEGALERGELRRLIAERKLFPCYFGSALKLTGVEELLEGLCAYTRKKEWPGQFGAIVFKIARDAAGNRLTFLKVTGGSLKVREALSFGAEGEEKISQIRIYSGEKYETAGEAFAGEVCAVTGLTKTRPGQGLGMQESFGGPILCPALSYQILLPDNVNALQFLPKLRQLEEEDPNLHLVWNEAHQEILVQVMGEVQTEILKRQALDRFGVAIAFDAGHILYKETIADTVEGVGHFEPLRHYAEVHLLLSPGERGSGFVCEAKCSEDVLAANWQRLILTHLMEKEHIGVLTGSAVTDIKATLVAGKAHQKHTEGGDFRQATYRAVRQGLMQAKTVLLEPYYEYVLEVPEEFVGRAMTDMEARCASMEGPSIEGGMATLSGKAPAALLWEYAKDVAAYAKGNGRLSLSYGGHDVCHNPEEVAERIGYDSASDIDNPTGSIFCSHGAGVYVEWDKVKGQMHIESVLPKRPKGGEGGAEPLRGAFDAEEWMDTEEVDAILARASAANRRDKSIPKKGRLSGSRTTYAPSGQQASKIPRKKEAPKEEYLLVDGYNVIFAWEGLKPLADSDMDGAKGKLLDLLCNYQGMKGCQVIAVFDAYRVAGHKTECFDYHNIHVVYTKEAETADAYIEKFAHENAKKYKVTVATSDGLEQIIIRGAGCYLLSARDLAAELEQMRRQIREEYMGQTLGRAFLMDGIGKEAAEQIRAMAAESEDIE